MHSLFWEVGWLHASLRLNFTTFQTHFVFFKLLDLKTLQSNLFKLNSLYNELCTTKEKLPIWSGRLQGANFSTFAPLNCATNIINLHSRQPNSYHRILMSYLCLIYKLLCLLPCLNAWGNDSNCMCLGKKCVDNSPLYSKLNFLSWVGWSALRYLWNLHQSGYYKI